MVVSKLRQFHMPYFARVSFTRCTASRWSLLAAGVYARGATGEIKGSFKCYVTQWGWYQMSWKKALCIDDIRLPGDGWVSNLQEKSYIHLNGSLKIPCRWRAYVICRGPRNSRELKPRKLLKLRNKPHPCNHKQGCLG